MKLLKHCIQKKSNPLIFIDVFAAPVMNESLLSCSTESCEKLWICYTSPSWFVIKLPSTEGYPANYDYIYSHLLFLTNYAHREMFLSFLWVCLLAVKNPQNISFEWYQGHLLDWQSQAAITYWRGGEGWLTSERRGRSIFKEMICMKGENSRSHLSCSRLCIRFFSFMSTSFGGSVTVGTHSVSVWTQISG